MGYTLNSAKDSKGDEHLFMEDFTKNRAAIEAYKRQHGGDLEGAYQQVTGRPWPAGRSVKISHGVPEMTKDRTVKSVLGKYVAPIAAGVLTGGAAMGWGPLAGLIGGGGAAAGGAGTAATAAGGVGAGTAATAASTAASAPGLLGKVWNYVKSNPLDLLQAGGRALTAGSQASATNRGVELDASLTAEGLRNEADRNWYDAMLAREKEGREGRTDAWKQLQQASYTKNWQQPPSGNFSPYSRQLTGPSEAVRTGAGGLEAETQGRLLNGNPLPMPERRRIDLDPSMMKPGGWESLSGYLGSGLDLLGGLRKRPGVSNTMPVRDAVKA